MKVVFATEVWAEVDAARAYYENEVEGLGKAFVYAVRDSIEEIKNYPPSSRIIRGSSLVSHSPFSFWDRISNFRTYDPRGCGCSSKETPELLEESLSSLLFFSYGRKLFLHSSGKARCGLFPA